MNNVNVCTPTLKIEVCKQRLTFIVGEGCIMGNVGIIVSPILANKNQDTSETAA